MKKLLIIGGIALLTAAVAFYVFRADMKEAAYDKITENMFVPADNDEFDPGAQIGTMFPGVRATYQGRDINLIQEFAGPNGTAFIATRSAEWCPFCMKQMIQLQEHKAGFDQAGIGMVAITYDDPVLQQVFVDKFGIQYPILHDVDTMTFKTLGILNEKYAPGDSAYGIPHPGMIVIDRNGIIVGKQFLEAYSVRVDAAAALAYASEALGVTDNGG
ncbi:MAG: redoxin domain-containing protein [Halioglobus sp.]